MKPKTCPNCGWINYSDENFCSICNTSLSSTIVTKQNPPPPIPTTSRISNPQIPISLIGQNPISTNLFQPSTVNSQSINLPHNLLPQKMNKYGPCLVEGEIVDIGQVQNIDREVKASDVIEFGLKTVLLFTDTKYGLMSMALSAKRPKEYRQIFILRVRSPIKGLVDVRVEKDIVGVSLNLKDYISVWGKESAGAIIMHHGYNHTVNGEIRLK